MDLFTKSTPKVELEKLNQIKAWVYLKLEINTEISISISQLQCQEPGCPPLETVIAVMTNPPTQYKIYKPAFQIAEEDIKKLSDSSSTH